MTHIDDSNDESDKSNNSAAVQPIAYALPTTVTNTSLGLIDNNISTSVTLPPTPLGLPTPPESINAKNTRDALSAWLNAQELHHYTKLGVIT